jgi:hypothetical protein
VGAVKLFGEFRLTGRFLSISHAITSRISESQLLYSSCRVANECAYGIRYDLRGLDMVYGMGYEHNLDINSS